MVIATATPYLLKYGYVEKENIMYYSYYDKINLLIDGKEYPAIVLDSCGACMNNRIIDIYTTGPNSFAPVKIQVK